MNLPPQPPQKPSNQSSHPPQSNLPSRPIPPPQATQPSHKIHWSNRPDPTFKQQCRQAWQQVKLSVQTSLANKKARQQFAQYQAYAYETNRGNGNCQNCGSPNVFIGTHSDGGDGCMTGIGLIIMLFFTCGLGLILIALSSSRKTGRFCRCMYCGQQWSA
jgi:hypothetical protein